MAYVLALLAALAFALGSVLQQKGTLGTTAPEGDPHFLAQIVRQPVWLAGGACQVAGWVLQAVALDRGSLLVVQSLIAMSLVLALPLGRRITDQQITRRVLLGAVALVAGTVLFLVVGSPQGGKSTAASSAWWAAGGVLAVVIGLLLVVSRGRRGAVRALVLGSAAGVCFAFQAAVTKQFMTVIGQGFVTIVSNWTTWALVVSALLGFVLMQSALKTGILAPAMGSSNAVNLFASVVLGIVVFGETMSNGQTRMAPAIIGLAIALAGIVLLAGAKPPSHEGAS